MASEWRLKCPVHLFELVTNKSIPISKDGTVSQCPMFFCENCNKYYIHTDAMGYNNQLNYNGTDVVNIEDELYEVACETEIICDDIKLLKSYVEPFVPDTCYKDDTNLIEISNGIFIHKGKKISIQGLLCPKCKDFYIDEDKYDEIVENIEIDVELKQNHYSKTQKKQDNDKLVDYNFFALKPAEVRKKVDQIKASLYSSPLYNFIHDNQMTEALISEPLQEHLILL